MRFLFFIARISVVVAAVALASCGQTGDLYLPKDDAPTETSPPTKPETAPQP